MIAMSATASKDFVLPLVENVGGFFSPAIFVSTVMGDGDRTYKAHPAKAAE
jgi:hypothetical protein